MPDDLYVVHHSNEPQTDRPYGVFDSHEAAEATKEDVRANLREFDDNLAKVADELPIDDSLSIHEFYVPDSPDRPTVYVLSLSDGLFADRPYGVFSMREIAEAVRESIIEEKTKRNEETVADPDKTLRETFEYMVSLTEYEVNELKLGGPADG